MQACDVSAEPTREISAAFFSVMKQTQIQSSTNSSISALIRTWTKPSAFRILSIKLRSSNIFPIINGNKKKTNKQSKNNLSCSTRNGYFFFFFCFCFCMSCFCFCMSCIMHSFFLMRVCSVQMHFKGLAAKRWQKTTQFKGYILILTLCREVRRRRPFCVRLCDTFLWKKNRDLTRYATQDLAKNACLMREHQFEWPSNDLDSYSTGTQ